MLYLVYSNTWCPKKKSRPHNTLPVLPDSKATGIGYQPSTSPRPLPWNVLAPHGIVNFELMALESKSGSTWFNSLSKFFCAKAKKEQLILALQSSLKKSRLRNPPLRPLPSLGHRSDSTAASAINFLVVTWDENPGGSLKWTSLKSAISDQQVLQGSSTQKKWRLSLEYQANFPWFIMAYHLGKL